jgi:Uma2 family endonuclease
MTASTLAKPAVYTAQDLERLSDERYHFELIQGGLRSMSPSGGPYGDAISRVSFYINAVVYDDDLGMTFAAETGFLLSRDPDTIKVPDFAFVRYEGLPDPLPEGFVPLVPDLVVETRSPNDTAREVAQKAAEWLAAGVRLVWVIEPQKRAITTYRTGRDPQVLTVGETFDGKDVLPDLSIPVTSIFPTRRN